MSDAEDWGTWRDNTRRGYLKGLDLSVDERLAWLDEMLRLALASGAAPRPRDAWGQPLDGARTPPIAR